MKNQGNKKNIISIVALILSAIFLLAGCGSGGGGGGSSSSNSSSSSSSGTTNVVITLGSAGSGAGVASYASASASIPSVIHSIKCVVSGPGMGIMETTVLVNGSSTVVIELLVPNGTARHFEIFAYDINGILIYYGDTYKDLDGVPVNDLPIVMAVASSAPGSISGVVTDAQTGHPVSVALISVYLCGGGEMNVTTSDLSGNYLIENITPGDYCLDVTAQGYFDNEIDVQVNPSANTVQNIALSREEPQGLRIVLVWGEFPYDLDSHLWLPLDSPYHISYEDMGNESAFPFAHLDLDDTASFGPETITIGTVSSGTYVYAVNNYSGLPIITTSQAMVQVYDQSGLIKTYNVPISGAGQWWHVFSININGDTIDIIDVNEIVSDLDPYL